MSRILSKMFGSRLLAALPVECEDETMVLFAYDGDVLLELSTSVGDVLLELSRSVGDVLLELSRSVGDVLLARAGELLLVGGVNWFPR